MSRRAALGAGLGVVTLVGAGRLVGLDDDALRALGASPHPEPDPEDAARLTRARREQVVLVAQIEAALEQSPDVARSSPTLLKAARSQLDQLGGRPGADVDPASTGLAETARAFAASARRREADALTASDVDLARVLASLSAGQAQIARTLGRNA